MTVDRDSSIVGESAVFDRRFRVRGVDRATVIVNRVTRERGVDNPQVALKRHRSNGTPVVFGCPVRVKRAGIDDRVVEAQLQCAASTRRIILEGAAAKFEPRAASGLQCVSGLSHIEECASGVHPIVLVEQGICHRVQACTVTVARFVTLTHLSISHLFDFRLRARYKTPPQPTHRLWLMRKVRWWL